MFSLPLEDGEHIPISLGRFPLAVLDAYQGLISR